MGEQWAWPATTTPYLTRTLIVWPLSLCLSPFNSSTGHSHGAVQDDYGSLTVANDVLERQHEARLRLSRSALPEARCADDLLGSWLACLV